MSVRHVFIIPEGPGTANRLQGMAEQRVIRMLKRGLQEADAALAAGQRDVATSKLRLVAQDIDSYLLSLANDVIGGTIK